MKRYLLLASCLFMLDLSSYAEFRVWRNTEGKSVTAEFKGMKDGKALLLREDGNEFLLSPDMLCEEDQAYIEEKLSAPAQVAKEETEQTEETPYISKSEANEIAEKYVAAIKDYDLEALKKLIWKSDDPKRAWEPGKILNSDFYVSALNEGNARRLNTEIKYIRIKTIKIEAYGYEVEVEITTKDNGNTYKKKGYIQMLRCGKIKYDTMGLLHPYEQVSSQIQEAFTIKEGSFNFNMYKQYILELDIPLFGYEEASSDSDEKRALKKIRNWLKDEGQEWDETEPRVPCQKEVFEYWVEALRSVENS